MRVIADLHVHSCYSRATSKRMHIKEIARFAKIKGLNVVGTGDFTHPKWLEEMQEVLVEEPETGLYKVAKTPESPVYFMVTTEVSTVFRFENEVKKVHHVILTPNIKTSVQISERLAKYGDLEVDGRPTLSIDAPHLVEEVMEISRENMVIPAHVWTPWFSVFGEFSGFDDIQDCYQDMTKHIYALETGLSCYDPDTEILTEEGWKKFTQVSNDDKICTLSKETEEIEYQHPEKIYSYDYEGKMYKVKTKRVDLLVTPNHKLAIRKYTGCPDFREQPRIELIRADERFGIQKVFKKDGLWAGKKVKHFVLPSVKTPHGNQYYSGNRKVKKRSLPIKAWLRFFGFWIAEGHTSPPSNGAYNVVISNSDKNLLEETKSALERMGFNPYLRKNQLRVRNYQLWKYLRQFGKAYEKYVPRRIRSLSSDLLRIFFDYYIKGDGHVYGRNNKGLSATTTSPKLRDDLQEIALKIGISAYWRRTAKAREHIFPSGHKNKHNAWTVYFIRKNEHRVYPAGVEKYDHWKEEWTDYEGKVYCVSVPNSIVYVRRNGIPVWCGNSDPAMNWRLSKLDDFSLVSNSDSHSFWPWRIGREANVFELDGLGYRQVIDAIRFKDKDLFQFTIETNPAYGKYHWTGHRKCDVALSPQEAIKLGNVCPVCRSKLTKGVEQRVEELADRPAGFKPQNAKDFIHLLPVSETIKTVLGLSSPYAKKVWNVYNRLIKKFGDEYTVAMDASKEALSSVVDEKMAEAIVRVREEKIKVIPGYDGVYGKIVVFEEDSEEEMLTERVQQSNLTQFM